eukprot:Hpha_TRINITY_DN16679_c3_g1::TRINITY_DN16679_c3_g1_i2::g.181119::m.181119
MHVKERIARGATWMFVTGESPGGNRETPLPRFLPRGPPTVINIFVQSLLLFLATGVLHPLARTVLPCLHRACRIILLGLGGGEAVVRPAPISPPLSPFLFSFPPSLPPS